MSKTLTGPQPPPAAHPLAATPEGPAEPSDGGPRRTPIVRTSVAGLLMGLANLVPGVSGGTMILVMGLYDEFISAIADLTRLRITRRNVLFMAVIGAAAVVAVTALAGTLSRAVTLHRSAMFSLFIGLTLGGVPLLLRMIGRWTPSAWAGTALGLALMVAIALTRSDPPDKAAIREAVAAGTFSIAPSYAVDVGAGALGMSAMVLPGVSGAYMLLVLGRYETILAAIALAKDFTLSRGKAGDLTFLGVLVPVGFGALLGLVLLSNFLKWALHRYEKLTLGALLGILLGSVVGIWPFEAGAGAAQFALGGLLAAAGLAVTFVLSRISA